MLNPAANFAAPLLLFSLPLTQNFWRHARHFDYGWFTCDASIDPVWNICSDRVDSLTPEDFRKKKDRVSISWMHGEQSHVFVPFMIHVFKQMGFSDIRTRFDYEDGDPFGD